MKRILQCVAGSGFMVSGFSLLEKAPGAQKALQPNPYHKPPKKRRQVKKSHTSPYFKPAQRKFGEFSTWRVKGPSI